MMSLHELVADILARAEHGHDPDNDDLTRLPPAIVEPVQAAATRLVGLAAAHDTRGARHERLAAQTEINDTLLANAIDPAGKAPASIVDRHTGRDAVYGTDTPIANIVKEIPR